MTKAVLKKSIHQSFETDLVRWMILATLCRLFVGRLAPFTLPSWGYPKMTASGLKKKSFVVLCGRNTTANSVSVRMFVRTPEAK